MKTTSKNSVCLWFDGTAAEAAAFYAATFLDSSVGASLRAAGTHWHVSPSEAKRCVVSRDSVESASVGLLAGFRCLR